MTDARRRSPIVEADLFDQAEGRALVDGPAAVLKGALECDLECAGLIVGPEDPFQRLLDCRDDPEIASVLQRHRFVFAARTTPERRLVEAGRLAARGTAIAVVAGVEVPRAAAAIARGGDSASRGLVVLAILAFHVRDLCVESEHEDDDIGRFGSSNRRCKLIWHK